MTTELPGYLKKIETGLRSGITTEHSHRAPLEALLDSFSPGQVKATNEPKRSECGAPDFVVSRLSPDGPLTVGYVECKDVDVSLDAAERSEQLGRYRASLSNLILTNYLEFRWYVDGEHRQTAILAGRVGGGALKSSPEQRKQVEQLLVAFESQEPAVITNSRELALRLARLTLIVREIIIEAFLKSRESPTLRDIRAVFAATLVPGLNGPDGTADFADMFAQTIAYGMFAARVNHRGPGPFQRSGAAREIPKLNPLLRQLFETVTGEAFSDEPYAGFVDDLAQLLNRIDLPAVLADFGQGKGREDPVVHFYESFLTAYDPKLRELRGVFYTPEPVVSYIVRSVDQILRDRFDCPDGLSDNSKATLPSIEDAGPRGSPEPIPGRKSAPSEAVHRVLILDPACGTGTFLYKVVDLVRERLRARGDSGMWSDYARNDLLPRLFGFELLMAPYAVAHFKLGLQLAGQDLLEPSRSALAVSFKGNERLGIYLTNSLEPAERSVSGYFDPFMRTLTAEASAASRIKRRLPIMVVVGNPPYSGHSANKGEWISGLVEDYKKGIPELHKPAQAKWLQDDYVKFIRLGQWRIDRTGAGILAFITNHAWLDNLTFRGMRQQLLQSFTDAYILNLHGNSQRRERTPDGSPDENVFDIRQGVCIAILIKSPVRETGPAVHYADLWGTRELKYESLEANSLSSTPWQDVNPASPNFLFLPRDSRLAKEYGKGWSLTAIFGEGGDPAPGIVTTQDEFAISWSESDAREKVQRFLATSSEDQARSIWQLCSQSQWNYDRAKAGLKGGEWTAKVRPILYRPFDLRWTVYDPNVAVHLRDKRAMGHLLAGPNLALITVRQVAEGKFDHALVSRWITESRITVSNRGIGFVLPLYLYPRGRTPGRRGEPAPAAVLSASKTGLSGRKPNLARGFIEALERNTGLSFIEDGAGDLRETFGPDDVFHYVYSLLNSPTYRSRYAAFLSEDFPRVPLPDSRRLFSDLSQIGADLTSLHLLDGGTQLERPFDYPVRGLHLVAEGFPKYFQPGAKPEWDSAPLTEGRVYISGMSSETAQFFGGVSPEIWAFRIGGYQVCHRWLRERRGRSLTYEEIRTFRLILGTIGRTIVLCKKIDAAIGSWPIADPDSPRGVAAGAGPTTPKPKSLRRMKKLSLPGFAGQGILRTDDDDASHLSKGTGD